MQTPTLTDFTNAALDAAYLKTAGGMLKQVRAMSSAPSSQMQKALRELDEEAETLEQNEQRMEPDNAQLEKTIRVLGTVFVSAGALIMANDNAIQASGQAIAIPSVTARVFGQLSGQAIAAGKNPIVLAMLPVYTKQLETLGIKWTIPTALDFAVDYVNTPAWENKMQSWGLKYNNLVKQQLLQGLQSGWGPKYTAGQVRQYAENVPYYAVENLTRTLQLTAYRDTSAAMDLVNGEFIEYKIRIAKLDSRTCLSCIDQHGKRLEKGERVDDHYRGRCDVFYVVKGGPRQPDVMQADSTPGNRRFAPYQTGPEWFAAQSEERQRKQASFVKVPAKWNAYKAGVPLGEFVGDREDDVFGNQVIEKSLIDALGKDAEQYYQRNQKGDGK